MFCNFLKSASNCRLRLYPQPQIKGYVTQSVKALATKAYDASAIQKAEEADALKIEANLFENAAIKHKPISTKDLLRQHKVRVKKSQPAPFAGSTLKDNKRINSKVINDAELGLQFIRLAAHDPQLDSLMTTVRSKSRHDKERQITLEGRRLIQEALECGLKMHALLFSDVEQLRQIQKEVAREQQANKCNIYKVAAHTLKMWSTLSTPPGLMGIFERPTGSFTTAETLPLTVVLDNIREPSNLGSIIRTCAAIPCQQVVVTRGCCDPWESKALRGGCGGHFRMNILDDVDWEMLPKLIPAESADDCCVFVAENNTQKLHTNTVTVDYADVKRTGAHNIVIIGGESHGVSNNAYKFLEAYTKEKRGQCLHIPLANGVESLNVASALTLILYELRKRLQTTKTTNY